MSKYARNLETLPRDYPTTPPLSGWTSRLGILSDAGTRHDTTDVEHGGNMPRTEEDANPPDRLRKPSFLTALLRALSAGGA
jgi:hypothetical protein